MLTALAAFTAWAVHSQNLQSQVSVVELQS
jgi:hypothetical protein